MPALTLEADADLWKVARVDTCPLPAEQTTELFAWLTGLDIPYTEMIPELVITQDAKTLHLHLHLSRQVRTEDGRLVLDHAANRVHTVPVVYPITDYPPFLVGVSQQQQAEREARHGGAGSDE